MIINDHALDAEMIEFCKSAIDSMPEADLVNGARKLPELLKGLKQNKPNVDQLRQRVLAKLQLKSPPPPILDILRTATLSDSLIEVFSDKAIRFGLVALMQHFGRLQVLTAMLLDSRESVRAIARAELEKPLKSRGQAKSNDEDTFKQRFKPLLETLRPILEDVPAFVPAARAANVPVVPTLNKAQQDRAIVTSTIYLRLQRDRNLLVTERDDALALNSKLSSDLTSQITRRTELSVKLDALQVQLDQRIAQGIADGLNNRLAPWLASNESLSNFAPKDQSALERAQQVLDRQAQQDKRFGIRYQVAEELSQARTLHTALKNAQQESLRPLPQLAEEIRALATHIEATEVRLNQTSIQPQTPQLLQLTLTLQALNDMDALQSHKKTQERTMLADAWSTDMCKQAYEIFDRQAMVIYGQHHHDHKDMPPPITPTQHLVDCLLRAKPCRLMIDGHNLLPMLKPLIGSDYFKVGQGPNAKGRALLIERVKNLTEMHPLLQADIWFDGPDDQHWSETENLRVWFSGGKGTDRADRRILESLQAEVYRGSQSTRMIVTEDRDLLQKAQECGAIGVSPLEMWAMVY
jgi:hypothetical protein